MKTFLVASVIIISFTIHNSFAQNFFPLKLGNMYQIEYVSSWSGPGGTGGSETTFSSISVLSDTVVNGEYFYKLSGAPFPIAYWYRYDPLEQKFLVKIPEENTIKLAVDFLGREVRILVNQEKPAGTYEVEFDGTGLPSGVYFYRIEAGKYAETKKLLFIK